ncbi:isocitrate lyase/phosphoenolpyruvate mutase family protein [Azospirillum sp. YIM DDC1]|uniref:Isocitrate lyase/phosphoenolpyruvate mutase family protein n=1 Tax=Azospirillum aestuarii TaxID=2802052 RepID=A0ABS1HS49_9PROT|nr:isocitrate lyase/phosphoenolpyruvate mutase family protein [Azospirillum aestuarii]
MLPNPLGVGSARMMEHMGFSALASTSPSYSWSRGRPENGVGRDDVLAHLESLVLATDLPVNADSESGFAHDLEEVAANVRRAVDVSLSGLSSEDVRADRGSGFYDTATSVERIRTAPCCPPTTPPSRCYARASPSPRWRTVSGRFKVSMSVP